jgi:molybdenum cofactor synthesis domain-containing protein
MRKTVGALLIGNEILTGKTKDLNGHFLSKLCFSNGLLLQQITVVPDNKTMIAEHLKQMDRSCDYIFTSGGIGPTHDDITYESIAYTYNLKLYHHPSTMDRMRHYFSLQRNPPVEFNEARKRMALIPEGSKVYYSSNAPTAELRYKEQSDDTLINASPDVKHDYVGPEPINPSLQDASVPVHTSTGVESNEAPAKPIVWVPLVVVRDKIHILPGIPSLFQYMVTSYFKNVLVPSIQQSRRETIHRKAMKTKMMEGDLASWLQEVQHKYPQVSIGSYPQWRNDHNSSNLSPSTDAHVIVTFEGDSAQEIDAAVEMASSKIPLNAVDIQDLPNRK